MACLLLVSSFAVAVAQESTSTGTMHVSVLPPGGPLTFSTDLQAPPGEEIGTSAAPAQLPATVSASIWLPHASAITQGSTVAPTLIIVQDERGTGAGWDVVLTANGNGGTWAPVLQGNEPGTITRLLPEPGTISRDRDAVSVGGTVSGLQESMVVLRADRGGGAGVFVQTLTITWPLHDGEPALVSVQLPSAP